MPTLDDLSIMTRDVSLKANDLIPVCSVDSRANSQAVSVPVALIGQGFTHAFRIDYNNTELLAETVDDTVEEIALMLIPANSIIDKVRLVCATAFAGLTAINAYVGRTADPDGYIATASLLSKTAKNNTGVYIDTDVEIDVVTGSDQYLLITFDPGANAEALDELTAGSVVVLVSLTEIADYATIAAAQ